MSTVDAAQQARKLAPLPLSWWANWTMAVSAAGMLASVALAYLFAEHLTLSGQIAAHLALPVAAGAFKLGYVARLVAEQAEPEPIRS